MISRTEQQLRAAIAARGCRILPIGDAGAVRVVGANVDIVAGRLLDITLRELHVAPLRDDRRRTISKAH